MTTKGGAIAGARLGLEIGKGGGRGRGEAVGRGGGGLCDVLVVADCHESQ